MLILPCVRCAWLYLEADVNYGVVKDFIARVRERSVGAEVSKALNPAQQVIKIVNEELINTLGTPERLNLSGSHPVCHHAGWPSGIRQDHRCRKAGATATRPGRAGNAGGC